MNLNDIIKEFLTIALNKEISDEFFKNINNKIVFDMLKNEILRLLHNYLKYKNKRMKKKQIRDKVSGNSLKVIKDMESDRRFSTKAEAQSRQLMKLPVVVSSASNSIQSEVGLRE